MIHLDPDIANRLKLQPDPSGEGAAFDAILALDGEVFREHKNRRTFRVAVGDRAWFIKVHGRTHWREILKNVLRGRAPILTAEPEIKAIRKLRELDLPTVTIAGYGVRGRGPAHLESFVITEALDGTVDLRALIKTINRMPDRQSRTLKNHLIDQVAAITRTMHEAGVNHRDLYTDHFLVADRDWINWSPGDAMAAHVIDLHRTQIRRSVPSRWLVKDLAGLQFSALNARLGPRDELRFLRGYWGPTWKSKLRRSRLFLRRVRSRAFRMYVDEFGTLPPLVGIRPSFA